MHKKITKILSLSLVLTLTFLAPLRVHAEAGFKDVEGPQSKAILYLKEKGVIQGYANGTFQPEKPISRAAFLKMLITNQNINGPQIPHRITYPFQDVPKTAWFAPSIQKAWELGLLSEKQLLHPGEGITRIEGTQYLLNILGLPIPKIIPAEDWPLQFNDVRSDMWYAPVVLYGTQYGLIKPLDPAGNYFRPLKQLTRGDAAELIYNMDVYLMGTQIFDGTAELEGQLTNAGLKYTIPHLDILADVWTRIKEEHFNPTGKPLSDDQLMYDALKGLVQGVGDQYSVFFDPPENETFSGTLGGQFGGIGAELGEDNDYVIIRSILIDSPAERAGLNPNDRIVKINGEDMKGATPEKVAQKIRGEVGTSLTLTIQRKETMMNLTLIRAIINVEYIKGKMLGNAIYMDINLFTSFSFIDFTQAAKPLIEKNPNFAGFIIDLRNNPGGYLESVKSIMGHFVPYGEGLLYIKTGEGKSELHNSAGRGEWENYPVVILINEGSASASEIMALTLQEHNGAVLIGKTSFGKGTVQEIIDYKDGSSLKLTIAEWRSPSWKTINLIGIKPDVEVELTPSDITAGRDTQLEAAVREFNKLIKR